MRFSILGPLQVYADGREVDLGGTKARSLLAILLINANQVVAADRLVDLLWGEHPPATATKALHVYVSQLRKAIAVEPRQQMIETRAPGYVIRIEPAELDLLRFENLVGSGRRALVAREWAAASDVLAQALALWRGPALSDFAYEPFAQTEIARLEELRIAVLEDRVESDLALGSHVALVPELEATIAQHPLRERLRAQLMLALYRSGRQVEALDEYRKMRALLVDELGLEPGPELQALHRAILVHDPQLAPAQEGAPATSESVTLLFGDFDGGAGTSPAAVASFARHHKLIVEAVDARGGRIFELARSGFRAAFKRTESAIAAAVDALGTLSSIEGVALPRLALHAGEVIEREADLLGPGLARCARLLGLGHPGQVLVSFATEATLDSLPAEFSLKDLGEHRLPDLTRRERIFQVVHPDLPGGFPTLRSLESAPNNLPAQLTSFVGREREMEDVMKLLWANRFVTLTGAGGCGKTRLALQVAGELVPEYRDGVWLVELAQISDANVVSSTARAALGIAEQAGRSSLDILIDHVRDRSLLLVLDNCEHLLEACAQLAVSLLAAAPNCRVLATSRAILEVPGETFYRVPSLPVPGREEARSPQDLLTYESVRLLVDRIASVLPEFRLGVRTTEPIVQICRRLDGLPLALELAAARARSLPLEQIAGRLDDRFRLLSRGRHTLVPRHQTLRAVMDWSYELLPAGERVLLARLSVFAGGFTLEAAEDVCAGGEIPAAEIFDALAGLVDKSLIAVDSDTRDSRYRLIETVRAYCRERLEEIDDVDATRARHASFFLALAEDAEPELIGPALSLAADRLEAEHDNIRAAVAWFGDSGRADDHLALAASVWRYCYLRGHYAEGRHWLTRALARAASAAKPLVANALYGSGCLAFFECDYEDAASRCTRALDLYQELNDKRGEGAALNRLGAIARERADYETSLELHRRALVRFEELGDEWEFANTLQMSGFAAWLSGDFDTAAALSGDSLDRFRALGDKERTAWALLDLGAVAHYTGEASAASSRLIDALALFSEVDFKEGIAWTQNILGLVAAASGDPQEAERTLKEALRLHIGLGDRWRAASVLEALASVLAVLGDHDAGCELLACAHAVRDEIGSPVPSVERPAHEETSAALRAVLGESRFETLWTRGLELSLDATSGIAGRASRVGA